MKTIFIFPHAGASANSYLKYKDILATKNVNVVLVEYKGHGSRYSEPMSKSIEEVAEDFINNNDVRLIKDYILFGHSYGTNVILEICHQLVQKGLNLPKEVYLSSGVPGRKEKMDCSKSGIKEFLIKQGMTDEAVITQDDIFDFFYPIISNDIENLNKYNPSCSFYKIKACLFKGKLEKLEMMNEWNKYFEINNFFEFEGGHGHIFGEDAVNKISSLMVDKTTYQN